MHHCDATEPFGRQPQLPKGDPAAYASFLAGLRPETVPSSLPAATSGLVPGLRVTAKRRILLSSILLSVFLTSPAPLFAEESATSSPVSAAMVPGATDLTAAEIVHRADAARFPEDSFQVMVKVESISAGKPLEPRLYRVFSKSGENTIVQTLEPAVERGQNMLMRGHDLWIFLPSVSQPVRLSLSQRLTGQVANGDLARANFAGDYTATLTGSQTIAGVEYHVLELVAARRGVTYPKVTYRVRKSDHRPHDAHFYSVSGRLLKTCIWEEFGKLGDRVRPTRLVMTDALKPDDVSVMSYSDLKQVKIPDRYFTKEFMKRLQ